MEMFFVALRAVLFPFRFAYLVFYCYRCNRKRKAVLEELRSTGEVEAGL